MIERDWYSFLDELLTYPVLHAVQQRLRQEESNMPAYLKPALMPLAYARPDQLATHDTAASAFQPHTLSLGRAQAHLITARHCLEHWQALSVLGNYLKVFLEHHNLPKPDEKLEPTWIEFLQLLRKIGHTQSVAAIRELDPYERMGYCYLLASTLKAIEEARTLPQMVEIVDKALATGT